MLISEVIDLLEEAKEKYGDINVCVFADYLGGVSETIVPEYYEDEEYFTICEELYHGEYLFLG